MGEVHQLVLAFGREAAQQFASHDLDPHLLDIASRVLSEENEAIGITYAGFCLTSCRTADYLTHKPGDANPTASL